MAVYIQRKNDWEFSRIKRLDSLHPHEDRRIEETFQSHTHLPREENSNVLCWKLNSIL